jgi:hypothetical protein
MIYRKNDEQVDMQNERKLESADNHRLLVCVCVCVCEKEISIDGDKKER